MNFIFFIILASLSLTLATSLALDNTYLTSLNVESSYPRSGTGRVLAQYIPRGPMTCSNYPRVCRNPGSPGPDCCRQQCVDVDTDWLNCGRCGRRCGFNQLCCDGKCVNVMFDPLNCGGCNNKCREGGLCRYGMCSYA